MECTKLTITSYMAHFKNSINGKNQNTFLSPPISTIVGILKNIYGDSVKDFIFGYTCEYKEKFKDVIIIYKEISKSVPKSKRFQSDICFIEYLVNPIITIYTDIVEEPIIISEILNLGKTNCLAKCNFEKAEILNEVNIGFNQWCPINIGDGIIYRINKETQYNKLKGFYDYYSDTFRFNNKFESQYLVDGQGVQMWKYEGIGDVKCY